MSALIDLAKKEFKRKKSIVLFVNDNERDEFLNDLNKYPHAFVLACIMDRQIKAERAWEIPYKIYKEFGTFGIEELYNKSLNEIKNTFEKLKLHRFNEIQAKFFHAAVQLIVKKYNGDAANIWNDNPSSATLVYRFLEFKGVGIKIATMAANILARQFKIRLKDKYSIDISPDVHVKRVLFRMGHLDENPTTDQIIYKARELNPEFPGLIDFSLWKIGREYCRPKNPNCNDCKINFECKFFCSANH
jgi:endonuclease III